METHGRFRQEEEKTALHVMCEYETLARPGHVRCRGEKPEAISYIKEKVSRLLSLIKKIKLDAELEWYII